jgi:transcriptional regulator with XRE-family HTH domain
LVDQPDPNHLLRHAAQRALQHPFFLAADLEDFRQQRGMQEADLARFLQCTHQTLPRLALCRRPNPESPAFYSDIQRIASALGVDPTSLVRLIREVTALRALQESGPAASTETGRGLLLAARDAEPEEPPDDALHSEVQGGASEGEG